MTSLQTHSYEHPVFKPGAVVWIDERIREIHPESPVAGEIVRVTTGTYQSSSDPHMQEYLDALEAERSHLIKVPVIAENGKVYFVEEEYVHESPIDEVRELWISVFICS